MQADARRRVALLLRILGGAVVIGAVFGATTGAGFRVAPVAGAMLGALAGAINGVAMAGVIFGSELFFLPTRLGHAIERQPFLLTFAIKVLVYGAVIVLVVAGGLGWRIVAVAPIPLGADLPTAIAEHLAAPAAPRVARGLVPVGLAIFMLQMSRLVGERTLRRCFLDQLGATPAQIATTRRLHLARQLLLGSHLRCADVALAAGYGSAVSELFTMRGGSFQHAAFVAASSYRNATSADLRHFSFGVPPARAIGP